MTGFSSNTLGNGTTLLLFLGQGSLDSESFVRRHGEEQIQLRAGEQRREKKGSQHLDFRFLASRIGEGNGNPLQCSCLENPRDGGAWWAAVYGVAQSRTQLKRLSSSSSHCHKQNKIKQAAVCVGCGQAPPEVCSHPRPRSAQILRGGKAGPGRGRDQEDTNSRRRGGGGKLSR